MKNKFNFSKFFSMFILILLVLTGCTVSSPEIIVDTSMNHNNPPVVPPVVEDEDEPIIPPIIEEEPFVLSNTIESHKMLEGTADETTVYVIKSNGGKDKIAIIGGTHGDEVAGWKAALKIVEEKRDFLGDILIIPQCNIQADLREERYAGLGKVKVNGEYYSDVNRAYPGYTTTPKAASKRIADAIIKEILTFGAQHIIDLHESRNSSVETEGSSGLGNLLIYGNDYSSWPALLIVDEFNEKCKLKGEDSFTIDTSAPKGSYNYYFGNLLENKGYVFTTETNRDINHLKGITLERRIEQQIQLVELILEYIYNN